MVKKEKDIQNENGVPEEQAGQTPHTEESNKEENGTPMVVDEEVISIEQYNQLKEELEKIQQQSAENSDGWQRERADFANYKKRIQRDYELERRNITGGLIKKFLPVLDDFERALKNRPGDNEGAAWADGMELVLKKFQAILDSEGIKRIEAENMEFDPNFHEAITYEESPDHGSGQIIEILQQGYYIDDRVLRPAVVRVAK